MDHHRVYLQDDFELIQDQFSDEISSNIDNSSSPEQQSVSPQQITIKEEFSEDQKNLIKKKKNSANSNSSNSNSPNMSNNHINLGNHGGHNGSQEKMGIIQQTDFSPAEDENEDQYFLMNNNNNNNNMNNNNSINNGGNINNNRQVVTIKEEDDKSSKKRKRNSKLKQTVFSWGPYHHQTKMCLAIFSLIETNKNLMNEIQLQINVEGSTQYMDDEECWVHYKQNQIHFTCATNLTSNFIQKYQPYCLNGNEVKKIIQFGTYIYAISS